MASLRRFSVLFKGWVLIEYLPLNGSVRSSSKMPSHMKAPTSSEKARRGSSRSRGLLDADMQSMRQKQVPMRRHGSVCVSVCVWSPTLE